MERLTVETVAFDEQCKRVESYDGRPRPSLEAKRQRVEAYDGRPRPSLEAKRQRVEAYDGRPRPSNQSATDGDVHRTGIFLSAARDRCLTTSRLGAVLVLTCVVASASLAHAADDISDSAQESDGIASRYIDDAGIENDPAVIFATSFENGIEGGLKKLRSGVVICDDPEIARTGNACAQITATRGKDTGGDLKYTWPQGVEKCYVRFYCRFHEDTVTPHHFVSVGGHMPTYKYRWGGSAGLRPPGGVDGAFGTTIEPPRFDKPGTGWGFYTYWHEMRSWQTPHGASAGRPNAYYGNDFRPDHQRPFVGREKWICVELMVKMNSIGNRDGEQAFWIDGKKVGHWSPGVPTGTWIRGRFVTSGPFNTNPQPFEGFDWRTDERLKINKSMLQWYVSDRAAKNGTSDENIVYFDNYVIATKYIGPVAERNR